MKVFASPGRENTESCISIAVEKAAGLNVPIVVASSTGATALALASIVREKGLHIPIIAVRGVFSFHEQNKFRMSEKTEQELLCASVKIVSAAHALSGAERGLSTKFKGVYPAEIIAHTLRFFGAGTKVCIECATMALNAGEVEYGNPVVAIAGTGGGSDTSMLLTPATSQEILQTKIHEIYCKPHL